MSLRGLGFFLIGGMLALGVLFRGSLVMAENTLPNEEERRQGFYDHQKENQQFDQDREAGLKAYLKEEADWEEQRKKDIQADKSRKKQDSPVEDGPEYKADRRERLEFFEEYDSTRRAYVKEKKALEPKNAREQAKREAWAREEYGLDKERPRFDITKRSLYNGKGGGEASPGSFGGGVSTPSFPPPPPPTPAAPFDDFGGEGYVPPPFPAPDAFDNPADGFVPPPPPPPFIPPEAGDGGGEGGFFPPPPPIPMPGDGDSF